LGFKDDVFNGGRKKKEVESVQKLLKHRIKPMLLLSMVVALVSPISAWALPDEYHKDVPFHQ
jgi:hypothetical protein